MMNLGKRMERLEQEIQTDQYSAIPKSERFVTIAGYTKEERDAKTAERIAEMHRKYGNFDEKILIIVHIRKFSRNRITADTAV